MTASDRTNSLSGVAAELVINSTMNLSGSAAQSDCVLCKLDILLPAICWLSLMSLQTGRRFHCVRSARFSSSELTGNRTWKFDPTLRNFTATAKYVSRLFPRRKNFHSSLQQWCISTYENFWRMFIMQQIEITTEQLHKSAELNNSNLQSCSTKTSKRRSLKIDV